MPYNTMNPVPSTDPRDLYDNAGITDKYVSGQEPFVPDRLGLQRRTWKGMEVDFNNAQEGRQNTFDQFLNESALIWIGDYGTGLTFTSRSQYMVRDGMAYRLATSTTIPYTTTGNWALEKTKFSLVNSDQILRQDLAKTDFGYGVDLVKGAARIVESIAELRTVPKEPGKMVFASGYELGTAGGGFYKYDAGDTTSVDNGGTIIVAADGGRWKLKYQQFVTVEQFGVLPIPGRNNYTRLQNAVATCWAAKIQLRAGSGTFEYGSTLDLDYPTLCLSGNGFRNTVFKYTGTNTAMQADGLRPNAGIYSIDLDLSDFTIEGNEDVTDLLRCRINHVRIVRVNVREASPINGCGLHIMGGVANHIEQFTCSTGTQLMTSRPANGIIFDANPLIEGGTRPTCNNLISPCIEGMLGDGIVLKSCDNLTVLGGTSENHDGVGLSEFSGCQMNTFIGMDNEANRGYADWIIAGQGTRLINCGSTKNFYIDNSARLTRVEGGWFDRVEVAAGAVAVTLDGLKVRFFGGVTGLITNNNPFLSTKNIFDVAANTFVFYSKPATGIALAVSPMTYTNSNITEETILIVGGTVTQLAYVRLGTPYLLNPSSGWIRLQPGDGITISYSGTPVITRVPGGTNNQ